jgi:hypothetical protein
MKSQIERTMSGVVPVGIHSFRWLVQNVTIPCRSQELLPSLSVTHIPFPSTHFHQQNEGKKRTGKLNNLEMNSQMYCTYKLLLFLLVLYCQESFCNVYYYNDNFYIHFGGSLEYWINKWTSTAAYMNCWIVINLGLLWWRITAVCLQISTPFLSDEMITSVGHHHHHHHHNICHAVGPRVVPFRSHVSRSLFKGLPWFLLPVGR